MPEVKTQLEGKEFIQESMGDFKAEQLFGSKTRVRLLSLLLENPDRSYYVRELTRRIKAQLNSVRREIKNLVDMGIVLEVEGKILAAEKDADGSVDVQKTAKPDKKKYYVANKSFAFFEELRSIMKKSAILMNQTFVRELNKNGKIDLLFLTGRFIDDKSVPSDVLVVGKIALIDLQKAIEHFEKDIGREINYTFMPKDEYMYRLEVKDRFLEQLIESDRVTLINNLPQ